MTLQLSHSCDRMQEYAGRFLHVRDNTRAPFAEDNREAARLYIAVFDEYGVEIPGHGQLVADVNCPRCGAKLPASKREAYFDRLEELEAETDGEEVPAEMQDASWWSGPAAPAAPGRGPDFRRELVRHPSPAAQ